MSRTALPALAAQLAHDGVDLAKAEIRLVKARLGAKVAAVRTGIVFLVAAALIAILGLIGVVVGCVLALAPIVGPGWAGLIVLGVAMAIAGVLGWLGATKLSTKPVASVERTS